LPPCATLTVEGGTPSQRAISVSSAALARPALGDRTHAGLQDALAAVILDADNLIAGRFGRQPHGKDHAVAASS
jgi:hypothetical protein